MKCLSPILLKADTPKLKRKLATYNAITGYQGDRLPVPCQYCIFCLRRKRSDWAFRMWCELKDHDKAVFITLTYSDENLPRSEKGLPTVKKKELQNFNRRIKYKNKNTRYYSVMEYGPKTQRPHYHGIYFGIDSQDVKEAWSKGHIHTGEVNNLTIAYTAKYNITRMYNEQEETWREMPKALMSRDPGLGNSYLKQIEKNSDMYKRGYVVMNGYKQAMPKYYKDRLYTDQQREILATNVLKENQLQFENEIINLAEQGYNDPWKEYDSKVAAMAIALEEKIYKGLTI